MVAELGAQNPLSIVHLKVYTPTTRLETTEVGLCISEITATFGPPGNCVHVPIPCIAGLPVSNVEVILHSGLLVAVAIVTGGNTLMVVIEENCSEQTPLFTRALYWYWVIVFAGVVRLV